jgi:membrane-associated PAP2 superfamily phosphatase
VTALALGRGASGNWRFAFFHVLLPVALGAALLWGIDAAGIDRALSDAFYDPATRAFPLRHAWLLDVVMHHWAKVLVGSLGALCVAGYALSFAVPPLAAHRRTLLFLALAMGLSTLTVSGLKLLFSRHCPWDLDLYGGFAPYEGLLQSVAEGLKPGHCFPGGHSSTGFALMSFYFVFYPHRRDLAALALAGGVAAGLALGVAVWAALRPPLAQTRRAPRPAGS